MFKTDQIVYLKKDDPYTGVPAGAKGVIMDVWENGASFTIEFLDKDGNTYPDCFDRDFGPDELLFAAEGQEPSAPPLTKFEGTLQKFQLTSNCLGYGIPPQPQDLAEQRVTVTSGGVAWISTYLFGNGEKYAMEGRRQFRLDADAVDSFFSKVCFYFGRYFYPLQATDIGAWTLTLTNTEGESFRFNGSLTGCLDVQGDDLSDLLRELLNEEELLAFNGDLEQDKVMSVSVEYRDGDYLEYLSANQSLGEVTQSIHRADGRMTERRIVAPIQLKYVLNYLCIDDLCNGPPPEPEDAMDTGEKMPTYKAEIVFKRMPSVRLEGHYFKHELPKEWRRMMSGLNSIVTSNNSTGYILDPSIYGHERPRASDILFIFVRLGENQQEYSYLCEDRSIRAGDRVIVPVGRTNEELCLRVSKAEFLPAEKAPFPLERIKKVIRKASPEELKMIDGPWYCPVVEREIDIGQCIDIMDVAEMIESESSISYINPPIIWDQEKDNICMECKHHWN